MNAAEQKKTVERIKDILSNQVGDTSDLEKKKSVIERKGENSELIKGVRMVVEYQSAPLNQLLARELEGSEKQVAWAKSIVAEFVAAAKREIESAVIRAEEGSMPTRWAYNVLDTVLDTCKAISNNAGTIISNRGQLSPSLISERAAARYNSN